MNPFATDTPRAEPTAGATTFSSAEAERRFAEYRELRELEAAVARAAFTRGTGYAPRFYEWAG